MAVRASKEMMFDASPEAILDAIADIEEVPAWSTVHRHTEVLDRYPDGRPHHVRATVKIMGKSSNTTGAPTGWCGTPTTRSSSAGSTASTT